MSSETALTVPEKKTTERASYASGVGKESGFPLRSKREEGLTEETGRDWKRKMEASDRPEEAECGEEQRHRYAGVIGCSCY